MRALGTVLNLIGGLILLYVGYIFARVQNFLGDGPLNALARKMIWNEAQIYVLTAVILFAVGIWALNQEPDKAEGSEKSEPTASKKTATFKGDRNLENTAYQIYLADKYGVKKNELFGSYQVGNSELYPDLTTALQAAHELDKPKPAAPKPPPFWVDASEAKPKQASDKKNSFDLFA